MVEGKKAGGVGWKLVERQDPAGGGELRRPDHVELQDVRVAGAGVEPLDVELMPLVGRVRRHPLDHLDARVRRHEPGELPDQDLALGAQRADRER